MIVTCYWFRVIKGLSTLSRYFAFMILTLIALNEQVKQPVCAPMLPSVHHVCRCLIPKLSDTFFLTYVANPAIWYSHIPSTMFAISRWTSSGFHLEIPMSEFPRCWGGGGGGGGIIFLFIITAKQYFNSFWTLLCFSLFPNPLSLYFPRLPVYGFGIFLIYFLLLWQ